MSQSVVVSQGSSGGQLAHPSPSSFAEAAAAKGFYTVPLYIQYCILSKVEYPKPVGTCFSMTDKGIKKIVISASYLVAC